MWTEDDAEWIITLQVISVLVRVPQRTEPIGWVCIKEKEIYFKELTHVIMKAGKSSILRMD